MAIVPLVSAEHGSLSSQDFAFSNQRVASWSSSLMVHVSASIDRIRTQSAAVMRGGGNFEVAESLRYRIDILLASCSPLALRLF